MKKYKLWSLALTAILPISFFVSCQTIENRISLYNSYEAEETEIQIHEGWTYNTNMNRVINSVHELNLFVDTVVSSFEMNYYPGKSDWSKKDTITHYFRRDDLYGDHNESAKNDSEILPMTESKDDFIEYWEAIKTKYNEPFFEKNSILVNPSIGKETYVENEEYYLNSFLHRYLFFSDFSADAKLPYARINTEFDPQEEVFKPRSEIIKAFLSKNNIFYLKKNFIAKETGFLRPIESFKKNVSKPGIVFIKINKTQATTNFQIKDKYSLNDFLNTFQPTKS